LKIFLLQKLAQPKKNAPSTPFVRSTKQSYSS
jgi:hypothetical protein